MTDQHYCYILFNDTNNCTYIGYTVNPDKRIRQHNGEIKGGARYTTNQLKHDVVWSYLAYITSPELDRSTALSLEWHLKHVRDPSINMLKGCMRKLKVIQLVLEHIKFTGLPYMVTVTPKCYDDACAILSKVPHVSVDKL